MQQVKTKPINRLVFAVSLTATDPGGASGAIECEHLPAPIPYTGLMDLALELDNICDYLEYPQAWECRRRYSPAPADGEELRAALRERWKRKGPAAPGQRRHFTLQIYCRQHVSLQGLLQFGKERVAFRSVLELFGLLQDAFDLDVVSEEKKRRTLPA